jgi:hypothetical protein
MKKDRAGIPAREIIFAEARSYVFVTGSRIPVGAGYLARSYAIAYSIRRGTRIPQMGYLFLAHLG